MFQPANLTENGRIDLISNCNKAYPASTEIFLRTGGTAALLVRLNILEFAFINRPEYAAMTGPSDKKDREKGRSEPTGDAGAKAYTGAERAGGKDRDIDDWLTRNLSAYYDDLLNEPMPDTIADLLRKLETKEIKK